MPVHEIFTFDKGINRKKSPLFLADNELYSAEGFSYGHGGIMECRSPKTLVTTPKHPHVVDGVTHIDSDDKGDSAYRVWGDGTYIYLANGARGIEVYSVDAAGELTHVDNDDLGGTARGVWGDGTYIYLANGTRGIEVYSVSAVGILTAVDNDDQGDEAYGVWGDGTFIYLANYTGGLLVYSVDAAGTLTLVDSHDPGGNAYDVWGDGTFIYLASDSNGLYVYSVDDDGMLTLMDGDNQGGAARGVWGDGTYVYLANYDDGLHSYSVNAWGKLTHIDNDDQGDAANKVWGDGTFIYVANHGGGLLVYERNAYGYLTYKFNDDQGDYAYGVWGDGTFIYLANYTGGIHSYSLTHSDLTNIRKIHRYNDYVLIAAKEYCPGGSDGAYFNYILAKNPSDTYFNSTIPPTPIAGNTKPAMVDYKKFTFIIDEEENKTFDSGFLYPWGIENPAAPTVADSNVEGNPDGTYNCYVTFYITFPNGEVYETGPSTAASVTVEEKKISWSNIPICQQTGLCGGELTIHRKLYRDVSSVNYLVHTIEDNTTITYTDNSSDTTIQANALLTTADYSTPPLAGSDLVLHLQRIWIVKGRYVYYSEPYIPHAFKAVRYLTVSKLDEDLVAGITWGDQLYFPSKETWYRLNGTDYATWSIKKTFTYNGIVNRDTLKTTGFGIIGLWYDGIYMFDGMVSRNITEKVLGRKFFTDLADLSVCYSELEGSKYHFYYASSGSTLNKHLVLDLANYPEVIAYHDDFISTAHEFHVGTGTNYLAKLGSEYEESGTETIVTSLKTGDRGFGAIAQRKNIEYLYYDINTGGVDVTVTIYVDGTAVHTITLNHSSRARKRSAKFPVAAEGYRASIGIDCTDSSGLYIYSPWILEATLVGV